MTIICVCGLQGSGKSEVANILSRHYGFVQVFIKSAFHGVASNNDSEFQSVVYDDSQHALEELTSRWMENFVISDLLCSSDYDILLKRPFTFVVEVIAPVTCRHDRLSRAFPSLSIAEICLQDDDTLFGKGLFSVFRQAKLSIVNANSMDTLVETVTSHGLNEDKWVRPSWDCYFMKMAELASLRSNCMKRSVGAILVKDRRVVSTGYNGTAKGLVNCRSGGCARCNGNARCGIGLEHCFCLHAEENALLEAGRVRCEGSTLYCTTAPCLGCSQKIIQCGVVRVIYAKEYSIEHDAQALMSRVGISLTKYVDPTPATI